MKKVDVTLLIKTSPENVISAFTDPEKLGDWWQVEKTLIELRPGGLYTLAWAVTDKGMGYVSSGIIKSYEPESELVIENFVYLSPEKPFLGQMRLTVRAIARENNSEVYVCQDGYQSGEVWDWYYEAVKNAWPQVMQTLKEYLEGHENK